jgi:nucleotidyltransferase AbiEii toxin of type IV toxin-antitoxin system
MPPPKRSTRGCSGGSNAMSEGGIERALGDAASELRRRDQPFALVGGLGVSIRAEVRFTRDVDLAIAVSSDDEVERLVRDLATSGYAVLALVEHDTRRRLATVRLRSPIGVVVDLLAASSGIEREVVDRAIPVTMEGAGTIPVARAEELLALKILSMTDARPQDRIDAESLLAVNPGLDLATVRDLLAQITARGFDRGQSLVEKLDRLVASLRAR